MAVKARKQKLYITKIKVSNGNWLDKQEEIATEAVLAYENQLNSSHSSEVNDLLMHVPHILSNDDNMMLEATPTQANIYEVIKSLPDDIAAGQDGFNGFFIRLVGILLTHISLKLLLSSFQVRIFQKHGRAL